MLDTLLGLLVVAALPLAIVAIPNTLSVVAELLPADIDQVGWRRTHGLALPALMLTVPLASLALRRVKAAHLLLAGVALVAVTDAAGGYAASELAVGVMRVLRGAGSGLIVTGTLVAVWDRVPALRALWVGVFSLSLLAAQALTLWPLDDVSSWKVTLQPYPMVTGAALALAAAYMVALMLFGRSASPVPDTGERGRLGMAVLLAAGIGVVAISTASEGWRAVPVMLLGALAIAGLLALASVGAAESRTLAYSMVAVGVVLLPSAAQVTLVEMGGLGGPGLRGLWVPYGVAGMLAIGASVVVRLFAVGAGRWLAPLGLLSMVAGLCAVRLMVPSEDGLVLVAPLTLLAVGAAVALTATLQEVGIGAAVFGLSLCFAGVLAGFLLGTGVQMKMFDGVTSAQQLVDNFVGALHKWALVGGFLLVAVIVLVSVMARRPPMSAQIFDGETSPSGGGSVRETAFPDEEASAASLGEEASGARSGSSGEEGSSARGGSVGGDVAGSAGTVVWTGQDVLLVRSSESEAVPAAADDERPTGAIPRVVLPVPSQGAFGERVGESEADSAAGELPAVPPPSQSPEESASP
ncbi:hypothetical protein ITP53_19095 [Nonomuraea sp. K274]|uniref:Uncharacterized protein n=1 Tax=Nonomuraea cypriaca TaxID=1187855 RepID=A0A931AEJ8_9ACTN|nr:hypothetical protein [Nonomuraea cypriaca]MBF8187802.1 hypothetical protein [Nonomuraea cypriaca]